MAVLSSCANEKSTEKTDVADVVLENILTRKSVRSYTDEKVPLEMVEKLLKAAMSAPSAVNRQPWEFIVVDSRNTLDTLASRLIYAKMLTQAPLAIVACGHSTTTNPDGSVTENSYWEHDVAAAAENLLLAAHAMGLGAVWTAAATGERAQAVTEILNLPDEVKPFCVIPIGFPAGNEQPKDKWKPEKVHYNKW